MKSPIYPDVEMKQIKRHGITIDYCPKSGGVWLDKGELEKLIELEQKKFNETISEDDNIPFSDEKVQVDKEKYKERSPRRKRRENPLEEIFDFFG
jgi:hypothetical protein